LNYEASIRLYHFRFGTENIERLIFVELSVHIFLSPSFNTDKKSTAFKNEL